MRIKAYELGPLGTNCYLVWDEESKEAMLIDPAEYEGFVQNQIEENGLDLKYVVLTHGHYDHIGGVGSFRGSNPGTLLAASEKDEAQFRDVPDMRGVRPDICLKEGDSVDLGALSFKVLETPGHTEGGLCFYIPECDDSLIGRHFSGTVFSGDTLFQRSIGRTDLGGGDFDVLLGSIRGKLFALPDDTLVLPGHMDATVIGDEKKYNPFVRQ